MAKNTIFNRRLCINVLTEALSVRNENDVKFNTPSDLSKKKDLKHKNINK